MDNLQFKKVTFTKAIVILLIQLFMTVAAIGQEDIRSRLTSTAWTNFKTTMTQIGDNGFYTDVSYRIAGNDFFYDGDLMICMSYPCFLESVRKFKVVSDSLFFDYEKEGFYLYGIIRFSGDTMIVSSGDRLALQKDYFLPREVDTATVDFLRKHNYDSKCLVGEWTNGEGQIVHVSFIEEEQVPESCYYPDSFIFGKDAVVIKDIIVFKGTNSYKIISVGSMGQFYKISLQSEVKGCRKGEVTFYQYVRPRG